jgi:hypothetical protein
MKWKRKYSMSFLRNRAKGEAYGSIIASGDNAGRFITLKTTGSVRMVICC